MVSKGQDPRERPPHAHTQSRFPPLDSTSIAPFPPEQSTPKAGQNESSYGGRGAAGPEPYDAIMWRAQWTVILGAWLVWGCGARSETQEAQLDYFTAREFCEAIVLANLQWQDRCFGDGRGYYLARYEGAASGCEDVDAELVAGRVDYHAEHSGDCVAQMSQRECTWPASRPAVCDDVLVGQIPEGQSCVAAGRSFESCEPGTLCPLLSETCPRCEPVAKLGDSCVDPDSGGGICEAGSICDTESGICIPELEEGEPCSFRRPLSCASGLACLFDGAEDEGTCSPPRTEGACTTSFECAHGYECVGGAEHGSCAKGKFPGDPCVPGDMECMFPIATCDANGRCVELAKLEHPRLHQPCGDVPAHPEVNLPCQEGLYCDYSGETALCQPETPDGASCMGSGLGIQTCLGLNAYCDPETQRCVSCD